MRQGSIENTVATQAGSNRAKTASLGSTGAAFGLVVACLFAAGPAHAKPIYPGKLVDAGATCVVTCLTCHTVPEGGPTNLRVAADKSPFGALFGVAVSGWMPGATAGLDAFDKSDADGDMVSDLAEVKAGRDPLIHGATSVCTPGYGCGARVAHAPPSNTLATTAALVVATALLGFAGRRRAKPRSS